MTCKVAAHKEACYCVQWNLRDGRLIASASQDKSCVVMTLDGDIVQVIQHTNACYGVSWDPFNRYRLATTCEDMLFYLWTFVEPSNTHPFTRILLSIQEALQEVVEGSILTNQLLLISRDRLADVA